MSDMKFDPDAELEATNVEMFEIAQARHQARLVSAYFSQLVAGGVPSDMAGEFTDSWLALQFDATPWDEDGCGHDEDDD